jgi:hypothetical protein
MGPELHIQPAGPRVFSVATLDLKALDKGSAREIVRSRCSRPSALPGQGLLAHLCTDTPLSLQRFRSTGPPARPPVHLSVCLHACWLTWPGGPLAPGCWLRRHCLSVSMPAFSPPAAQVVKSHADFLLHIGAWRSGYFTWAHVDRIWHCLIDSPVLEMDRRVRLARPSASLSVRVFVRLHSASVRASVCLSAGPSTSDMKNPKPVNPSTHYPAGLSARRHPPARGVRRSLGFQFLERTIRNSEKPMISPDVASQLLRERLTQLEPEALTAQAYNVFEHFFHQVGRCSLSAGRSPCAPFGASARRARCALRCGEPRLPAKLPSSAGSDVWVGLRGWTGAARADAA